MTPNRRTQIREGLGRPAGSAALLRRGVLPLLMALLAGCSPMARQDPLRVAGAAVAVRTNQLTATVSPGTLTTQLTDARGIETTPVTAAQPSATAPSAAPLSSGPSPTASPAASATARPSATSSSTASASPIPSATLLPTSTPLPPSATPVPLPELTAPAGVNVRQGPGTDYPTVGALRAGETYRVTGKNRDGSWVQFTYNGAPGWVRADLVTGGGDWSLVAVARDIPAPPVPTATRPLPTPVPAAPADPTIADLVARINQARADTGLSPLAWSPELAKAAGAHVNDMASHNFFSHTGSDGSDLTVRMRRAGYQPAYWGEILTHVNGGADGAFGQFWGSQHHHDIMMGGNFRDIGAAWITDPADNEFNYFAVVFGRR